MPITIIAAASSDEIYRALIRILGRDNPQLLEELEAMMKALEEFARQAENPNLSPSQRRWFERQLIRMREAFGERLGQLARRCETSARVIRQLGRLGRLPGIVGEAFGMTAQGALIGAEIVLYTAGPGEGGGIAIPLDRYDYRESFLVSSGDPEEEFKCFVACAYTLSGHLTWGEPADSLSHEEGDANAPVMYIFHQVNCDRPPTPAMMREMCRKNFFVQME